MRRRNVVMHALLAAFLLQTAAAASFADVTFYPPLGSRGLVTWPDTGLHIATWQYASHCTYQAAAPGTLTNVVFCRAEDTAVSSTTAVGVSLDLQTGRIYANPAASALVRPVFSVSSCSVLPSNWYQLDYARCFKLPPPAGCPAPPIPTCEYRYQCYVVPAGLPRSRFDIGQHLHADSSYYCCTTTNYTQATYLYGLETKTTDIYYNQTTCTRILPSPVSYSTMQAVSCLTNRQFMQETCRASMVLDIRDISPVLTSRFRWSCDYNCGVPCVTPRNSVVVVNGLCTGPSGLTRCTNDGDLVHASQCTQNALATTPSSYCLGGETAYISPQDCAVGSYSGCNITCECPMASGGCKNHAFCSNRGTLYRDPEMTIISQATSGISLIGTCRCNPSFRGPTCLDQAGNVDCHFGQET